MKEDEYKYSARKVLLSSLNEMKDYAQQHEVISKNVVTDHSGPDAAHQELKQERK